MWPKSSNESWVKLDFLFVRVSVLGNDRVGWCSSTGLTPFFFPYPMTTHVAQDAVSCSSWFYRRTRDLLIFVLHSWKTCNAITAINSMCAISWLHFTCIQESWFNPSPWLLQWDLWEQSDIASKVPSLAHFFLTRRVGLVHPRTWPLFSLSMGSLCTTWSTQEGTLKQRCVPEKWRQVMRSKVFSGR
jgi:hypothetical protein